MKVDFRLCDYPLLTPDMSILPINQIAGVLGNPISDLPAFTSDQSEGCLINYSVSVESINLGNGIGNTSNVSAVLTTVDLAPTIVTFNSSGEIGKTFVITFQAESFGSIETYSITRTIFQECTVLTFESVVLSTELIEDISQQTESEKYFFIAQPIQIPNCGRSVDFSITAEPSNGISL